MTVDKRNTAARALEFMFIKKFQMKLEISAANWFTHAGNWSQVVARYDFYVVSTKHD